jgi:hypothetical protein
MQATRDLSHYVRDMGSGFSHIDLVVEDVSCAGLHVKDRKRSFSASGSAPTNFVTVSAFRAARFLATARARRRIL